jgi:hypothetical protein
MTAIWRRRGAHNFCTGLVTCLLTRAIVRITRGPTNDDVRAATTAIELATRPGTFANLP